MPARRNRRSRRRFLGVAVLALLGLVGLVIAGRDAWRHETESPLRSADATDELLVVPPGASAEWMARQLQALGFVRHPLVFRIYVHNRGVGTSLRAGEYALSRGLSLAQVVDKLVRGDVVRHEVTFPEGKDLAEAAAIAAAKGIPADEFLAAARDPAPIRDLDPKAADLEGYLFPDTYDVPRGDKAAAQLVARMVGRFRDVIGPELPKIVARGGNVREVVTLASIVELETARPEERARIAAVFQNRLAKRMPFQTDPTVIYALKQKGTWDGNIRKRDLSLDSPFNTYRFAGLPPGPIASPGRESLRAVLAPTPGIEDLYFVSRNDGSHQFSRTLAEHNRAVDQYQKHRPPSSPRASS